MRWLASILVAAFAAIALSSATSSATGAVTCKNLRATPELRAKLVAAHARKADGPISKGSVYYGRCGSTRYAIASFSKALADQPEKFRMLAGRRWVDKGDGFENGCDAGARSPIPKALVRLWHVCPEL